MLSAASLNSPLNHESTPQHTLTNPDGAWHDPRKGYVRAIRRQKQLPLRREYTVKTKDYSIAQIFNLPEVPATLTVQGYEHDARNIHIPETDPNYIFRKELLSDILAWHKMCGADSLYLVGPTGSGKSSVICQLAGRLGIPVLSVNAHARMEYPELVGQHVIVDGSMQWVDGPLTIAKRNGWWFMIDEIDLLDPSNTAGLNSIAEGRALVIPEKGGEVVKSAPGFRFICTANTAGSGDNSGLYQGCLRQNIAFLDRFMMVEVPYADEGQELTILSNSAPQILEPIRQGMVRYANEIRRLFIAGELEVTLSTRTLVRWARMASFYKGMEAQGKKPLIHALDRALGFRAEPESRQALHEIAQRIFG
jgi:cobaltochelatase CobS